MIGEELQKIEREEKTLNNLLKELEHISKIIKTCSLNDFDKNLFIEFLERVYYSRDELRNRASKLSKKRVK